MNSIPRLAAVVLALAVLVPAGGARAQRPGPVLSHAASGTSWEPRSTVVAGVPFEVAGWSGFAHGFVTLLYLDEGGPRGDRGLFPVSMAMGRLTKNTLGGELSLRAAVSADPSMGPRGYPSLLQTGESADGQTPLFDRQHPHDLVMELGATFARAVEEGASFFAYLAAVGEPAFGPGAFLHRGSGRDLPRAPISHHVIDGAHLSQGVATAGLVSEGRLRVEASLFNGREPDERRWDLEAPSFDSYSFRVSARAGDDWLVQASVAQVTSPERLHPGIDVTRLSVSATHSLPLAWGDWQTTVALGRSKSALTTIPVVEARLTFSQPVLDHYLSLAGATGIPLDSLLLYFPERVESGALVETTLRREPWTLTARWERSVKADLFAPADARHSQFYTVGRVDAAVILDLTRTSIGALSLGIGSSARFVPDALRQAYGPGSLSWHGFTRLTLG